MYVGCMKDQPYVHTHAPMHIYTLHTSRQTTQAHAHVRTSLVSKKSFSKSWLGSTHTGMSRTTSLLISLDTTPAGKRDFRPPVRTALEWARGSRLRTSLRSTTEGAD